jgi:pimeloyl-ACP methyl ester carboxylesterase
MPFADADNLRVHYIERGEGEPVVLVHGNWGTSSWWEPVLERLPDGYRGIAYDLRGRGKTEGPESDYTMPEMAADLHAFLEALGLDRVHLVGHSLGSVVAMQFLLDWPERVLTFVAVSPAWVDGMPEAYNVPAGQQAIKADRAMFANALKALAPGVADDEYWQRLVAEGHEQRIEAALRNLPALVAWKPGDKLREAGVPALVIAGDRDPLTGGDNATRAAEALGAGLVSLQGIGHSPNIEAPDEFVRLLLEHVSGGRAAESTTTQKEMSMANGPLLPGITEATVDTGRLKMHVLVSGPQDGDPVVLVHGNMSSGPFWEETMLTLAAEGYRVLAPDLRGYGDTEAVPVDGTRGMRDWSDDLKALVTALDLGRFHLVGWSMGGGVAMQYAIDNGADLLSLTLESPISPYGFGGTKDAQGTPNHNDYAGSGGGTANPEYVRLVKEGDRGGESPFSARSVLNNFYFKPPFRVAPAREEAFVTSVLKTRIGDDFYPGGMTDSPNWPNVAPGTGGFNNAMSPRYLNLGAFANIEHRTPVLWVRGADDQIVSDTSLFDFGFLGQIGAVPGWPGAEVCPPQPMIAQTRAVLDAYKANGGGYWELTISDSGHSPHIEKPEEFNAALLKHLRLAAGR